MAYVQAGGGIRQCALDCLEAFNACVTKPGLKEQAWILAAQGDFNLWCSAIKATKEGRSSMDHRLRRHPELVESVCDLLAALTTSVEQYGEVVSSQKQMGAGFGTDHISVNQLQLLDERIDSSPARGAMVDVAGSADPHSEATASATVLAQYADYIRTILDDLIKISLAIRRAGSKYRTDKEYTNDIEESNQDLHRHLTCIILASFEDPNCRLFSTEEKIRRVSDRTRLGIVQRTLVEVNILRRNRIEDYHQRSATTKKVQERHAACYVAQLEAENQARAITQESVQDISGDPRPQHAPQTVNQSRASTNDNNATSIDSQLARENWPKASSGVTKVTRIASSQAYPKCPKPSSDGRLECPYCSALLPLTYLKEENSWKAHVTQDIMPYSCIFERCDTPHEMYGTTEELLYHMVENHSMLRWSCDYCSYGSDYCEDQSEQAIQVFDSAEAWKAHMEELHDKVVPKSSRSVLVKLNERQMFGPLSCPLCEFDTPGVASTIHEHILKHLHEFSLRCLPQDTSKFVDEASTAFQESSHGALLSHTLEGWARATPLDYSSQTYPSIGFIRNKLRDVLKALAPLPTQAEEAWRRLSAMLDIGPSSIASSLEVWESFSRAVADFASSSLDDDMLLYVESIGRDKFATQFFECFLDRVTPILPDPTSQLQISSPCHRTLPPTDHWLLLGQDKLLDEWDDFFLTCSSRLETRFAQESDTAASQFKAAIKHIDSLTMQPHFILTGQHGIGKTKVARTIAAKLYQSDDPGCSVFWIDARNEQSIKKSYAQIWECIGQPASTKTTTGLDVRNRTLVHYLTWTFSDLFVLILDGLEAPGAMYLKNANMLPRSAKGIFLFTTIHPRFARIFGDGKVIEVPPLEYRAALQLFYSAQGDPVTPEDRPKVEQTVSTAGGLPSSIVGMASKRKLTDSLKFQLNRAFLQSKYGRKQPFLPVNELERLVSKENVSLYCSTYAATVLGHQTSEVVDYVFGPRAKDRGFARHVFAILVLIDLPTLIPGVVEQDIRDRDLPLARCDEQGTEYQLARRSDMLLQPIECFKTWKLTERRAFDEMQFQVKPPIFKLAGETQAFTSPEYVAMELENRAILPLTSYDERRQIIGGSSKVVRIQIHDAHHDFNSQENQGFAMKTLDAGDSQSQTRFRLEVIASMKIRAKESKHLVKVLTTFKYDNKYHLIFHWASGGSLLDLWGISNLSLSHNSACWLAQQCWGLADGLDGIHRAETSIEEVEEVCPSSNPPSPQEQTTPWLPTLKQDNKDCGRHGDIKPPNILWFKQDHSEYGPGVLKISDFGLTTFHSALTTRIDPRLQEIELTLTYAPPEWDLKEDISRSFDIWSLGCVYLEFLTWALLGSSGVRVFRSDRSNERGVRKRFVTDNFYSILGVGEGRYAIVKRSVHDWIQSLKKSRQCSPYMIDFLDYIECRMIVVDKSKRDKSYLVTKRLSEMFQNCIKDSQYANSSRTESLEPQENTSDAERQREMMDDARPRKWLPQFRRRWQRVFRRKE